MEFAFGVLRWTPDAFWNCTILELTSAYVGYARREGIGRWQKDGAGFDEDEANEMLESYRAMSKKFGDAQGKTRAGMTKAERRAYKAQLRLGGGVIRGG